jgi:hypothetical protein
MQQNTRHMCTMKRMSSDRVSTPTMWTPRTCSPIMVMRHQLHLHKRQGTSMVMMTHQPGAAIRVGIELHLGQKPKLGGRYADDSLIYISYLVGSLYIHILFSVLF